MQKFQYPKILEKIFENLNKLDIKPVIIGGYVRDFLLGIKSKDIDIELYNVENIDILENLLQKFGSVNEVGKSFNVIKLCIDDLDLDFSLPRIDSKIAKGHRGFKTTVNSHLDFKTATSRRDFTINAIGYDVVEQKLLDPFGGIEDLKNKELKAVDIEKFGEDPLRVFRAIQFASRFDLEIDKDLLILCEKIVKNNQISYLSKERIYIEIEKLLLKAPRPSTGFILLKKMGLFQIFKEFEFLTYKEFLETINLLDHKEKFQNNLTNKQLLITMFTLLTSRFDLSQLDSFLHRLCDDKGIVHTVTNIHNFFKSPNYTLAMRIDKTILTAYLKGMEIENYKVIVNAVEPKIKGKDLIASGLQPSEDFGKILQQKYQEQIANLLVF
jgi:tRNA nucleotidyltransferase (CCA-adding enzyme)